MLELSVDINSKSVTDSLDKISRRLNNMAPVMDEIGMRLETRVSARFETESDPLGHPWAPWSQGTRDSYPKDGHGRILERYADMMGSLNHDFDSHSVRVGFGAVASKDGDVYAAYHEWGTRYMPRRGLLMADPDEGTLGPDDEAAVLDVLSQWLDDLTR